jgi:hypothetical protein
MTDFKMNWGTKLPDMGITDFSEELGSWGRSKAGGGFDFKASAADTSPTSFDGLKAGAGKSSWQTKWLGGTDENGMQSNGIIPVGIGALSGLAGAYLGWQQFNLAKDQLAQNKKIFNLNFGNQAKMVNTQLEDRQRANVRGNPAAYESVDSYMAKNAVQTKGI